MNERGWGSICGARRVRRSGAMGLFGAVEIIDGGKQMQIVWVTRREYVGSAVGVGTGRRSLIQRSTDYMIPLITALFNSMSLYMDRTVYPKILLKYLFPIEGIGTIYFIARPEVRFPALHKLASNSRLYSLTHHSRVQALLRLRHTQAHSSCQVQQPFPPVIGQLNSSGMGSLESTIPISHPANSRLSRTINSIPLQSAPLTVDDRQNAESSIGQSPQRS